MRFVALATLMLSSSAALGHGVEPLFSSTQLIDELGGNTLVTLRVNRHGLALILGAIDTVTCQSTSSRSACHHTSAMRSAACSVRQGFLVFELSPSEDRSLPVGSDTFFCHRILASIQALRLSRTSPSSTLRPRLSPLFLQQRKIVVIIHIVVIHAQPIWVHLRGLVLSNIT